MSKKILLRKTCNIYASDLHFATMIFPFVNREIENNTVVKTILENNVGKNIEKIIKNMSLETKNKEEIEKIDWTQTSIDKIKTTLKEVESILGKKKKVDIIVCGTNLFIEKVNKVIDIWIKMNLTDIENSNTLINIINCYSFDENKKTDNIIQKYEYILKTTGIEEIYEKENLKKAN